MDTINCSLVNDVLSRAFIRNRFSRKLGPKLQIDGDKIIDLGEVFTQIDERLRDIAVSPEGVLYILSDGSRAKLLKVEVAE